MFKFYLILLTYYCIQAPLLAGNHQKLPGNHSKRIEVLTQEVDKTTQDLRYYQRYLEETITTLESSKSSNPDLEEYQLALSNSIHHTKLHIQTLTQKINNLNTQIRNLRSPDARAALPFVRERSFVLDPDNSNSTNDDDDAVYNPPLLPRQNKTRAVDLRGVSAPRLPFPSSSDDNSDAAAPAASSASATAVVYNPPLLPRKNRTRAVDLRGVSIPPLPFPFSSHDNSDAAAPAAGSSASATDESPLHDDDSNQLNRNDEQNDCDANRHQNNEHSSFLEAERRQVQSRHFNHKKMGGRGYFDQNRK